MEVLQQYGKEIAAFVVPIVTWVLNYVFRARAKLIYSSPHSFNFLVQQPLLDPNGNVISPTQNVNTRSTLIQNNGKEAATNLELVFNWKPLCINIWPSRHYEEKMAPDKRYVVALPSLAPNEFIGCEIMTLNADLPALITVRCDQCPGQLVKMYPQIVISTTLRRVVIALLFMGLGASVYLAILLLQFLIVRTY